MLYSMYPLTVSQIKDIVIKLFVWRKDRKLSVKSQVVGLYKNIEEELKEYQESKEVTDKIDALCDISVFIFNSLNSFVFTDLSKAINKYRGLDLPKSKEDFITGYGRVANEFPLIKSNGNIDPVNAVQVLGYVLAYIDFLGYNPYISMVETLKEISSRTGSYSEKDKKWIKDTSEEAKAKWYNANYGLAQYGYIIITPPKIKPKPFKKPDTSKGPFIKKKAK